MGASAPGNTRGPGGCREHLGLEGLILPFVVDGKGKQRHTREQSLHLQLCSPISPSILGLPQVPGGQGLEPAPVAFQGARPG